MVARPSAPPFTGERLMPYLGEGMDRMLQYGLMAYSKKMYQFIAARCKGKRVLDVGSGTGYGLSMLHRQSDGAAWGTDIASDIIGFSASYHPFLASRLLVCDSLHLALAADQFDLVSAIEVIEHVRSGAEFVSELVRVVRKDGSCILSTPNHPVVAPTTAAVSPFHTKEYDFDEFAALLREFFADVQMHCVRINHRIFLARYVPPGLDLTFPFPLANIERHVYWHFPPWNKVRVGLKHVEILAGYHPHSFGLLAICSRPRK
jgi:ubiquinone/menaquinone biosynthesis C-methylase UbiE